MESQTTITATTASVTTPPQRIFYLEKVEIINFRLLKNVSLFLEDKTTVIVGRNNSGKTSLTELFRRLLSEKRPTFSLEDFALSVHENFWAAYNGRLENKEEKEIRQKLPVIEVKLTITYDKNAKDLGVLSDFIIDLNPDCTSALIVVKFQLKDGEIDALFEGIDLKSDATDGDKINFYRTIKERVPLHFDCNISAVDPNDPTNQKILEWSQLKGLLYSGFINAQRGLNDITHKDQDVLGKILETLLKQQCQIPPSRMTETLHKAWKMQSRQFRRTLTEVLISN